MGEEERQLKRKYKKRKGRRGRGKTSKGTTGIKIEEKKGEGEKGS